MKQMYKSTKWFMLISGILITILGITMLFTPIQNLLTLAVFIGFAMLISGVSEIVSFCSEEKAYRSGWMLASGIISALLGIWTIFGRGSQALIAIIPFVFAVWIMSSSITRIVGSISLKEEGFSQWGWVLALGILGTILGFIIMFTPLISQILVAYGIAVMLIIYGINNILIFYRMKKIGNHIRNMLDF